MNTHECPFCSKDVPVRDGQLRNHSRGLNLGPCRDGSGLSVRIAKEVQDG